MLKQFVVMVTVLTKLAVVALGANAISAVPTEFGPEPGCYPGDPCGS